MTENPLIEATRLLAIFASIVSASTYISALLSFSHALVPMSQCPTYVSFPLLDPLFHVLVPHMCSLGWPLALFIRCFSITSRLMSRPWKSKGALKILMKILSAVIRFAPSTFTAPYFHVSILASFRFFSRVLRDSMNRYVGRSVGRLVRRSPFAFLAFLGVFCISAPAFSLLVF